MSNQETQDTTDTGPDYIPTLRDKARQKFFQNAQAKRKGQAFTILGVDVELRRPSLGRILGLQEQSRDDARGATLEAFITCVFVAGTDEPLFQPDDMDQVMSLEFDKELEGLINEIGNMMGVKQQAINDQEKNSETTQ